MFLAAILICTIEGDCKFITLETIWPSEFYCNISIENAESYFNQLPKVDYAEGRCIRWGNLVGDRG